ncbi:polysaccharide deacetylase family protein [Spongiimicrobium salis]|uniref:polysaccharide deacetylase family protein n=1 Tax=Spongiimicrobium salis TaxID=1667022 RepID=UPI00374CC1A9
MKSIQRLFFPLLILFVGCKESTERQIEKETKVPKKATIVQPTVSFTFDDGNTSDILDFPFEEWNSRILSHLEKEQLKAVFFVTGRNKLDKKGQFLLESWNAKGHKIANHSYSHPNFNSPKNTASLFEIELKKTDAIISKYSNAIPLFRFPYLKEGQHKTKVDSIRNILAQNNYTNGYVTIDASDWYVNQRLIGRIKKVGFKNAEITKYKDFYIGHILERAQYYEKLSYEINGRHIPHTLLLHHNLTSALFLGDLIAAFKEKGWNVINAADAFQDDLFKTSPKSDFAGESLIYALAKQSGKYQQSLRYPAEDSRYEKDKMSGLGL